MPPSVSKISEIIREAGSSATSRGRSMTRWAYLLVLAEVAVTLKHHWENLSAAERRRLQTLVAKSKGRPSNLTERERRELKRLVDKLEPRDLARNVADRVRRR